MSSSRGKLEYDADVCEFYIIVPSLDKLLFKLPFMYITFLQLILRCVVLLLVVCIWRDDHISYLILSIPNILLSSILRPMVWYLHYGKKDKRGGGQNNEECMFYFGEARVVGCRPGSPFSWLHINFQLGFPIYNIFPIVLTGVSRLSKGELY